MLCALVELVPLTSKWTDCQALLPDPVEEEKSRDRSLQMLMIEGAFNATEY